MAHDDRALEYAKEHSTTDSPLLREITETTRRELERPQMLSDVLDGGLLSVFVHTTRAARPGDRDLQRLLVHRDGVRSSIRRPHRDV